MSNDIKIVFGADASGLEAAARRGAQAVEQMQGSMVGTQRASEALTASFARMGHVAAGAFGAREIVQAADAWANLNARLSLVTDGSAAAALAYERVLQIAKATRMGLEDVGAIYEKFARQSAELGLSADRIANLTTAIAQAMTISGASAQAAQAALTQFGQALSAGALRGEELNSILEQAPRLAQALANGLGVPIGKLRELGQVGELTADKLVGALEGQAGRLQAEFERMPVTIGAALTNIKTAWTDTVGSFEQSTGVFRTVAGGLGLVADNMGLVAASAGVVAAVMAGRLVGAGAAAVSSLAAQAAAAMAVKTQYDAFGMAIAATSGRAALAGAAVSALGGPIGMVTAALTLGATAWALWGNSAEEASRKAFDAKGALERLRLQEKYGVGELAEARRLRDEYSAELAGNQASISPYAHAGRNQFLEKELKDLTAYIKAAESLEKGHVATVSAAWEKLHQTKQQQRADEVEALNKAYGAELERHRGNTAVLVKLSEDYLKKLAVIEEKYSKKMSVGADVKAYASLIKSAQDYGVQLAYTAAHGQQMTTAQKALAAAIEMTGDKLSAADRALLEGNVAMETRIRQIEDTRKAQEEFTRALARERQERARVGQDIQDKAAALELELENYGLLESAIYDKTIADLEEARILAMKEQDHQSVIDSLDAQIEGYKRLAAAQRGIEARDTAKKAAEDAGRAWQKFSDDTERSLTDALMRGFEAGNDFGENFIKTLENTLKAASLKLGAQVVLNPVTGQGGILQQAAGALGLAGQESSGSTGSYLSTAKDIWGIFNNGGTSMFDPLTYSGLGASLGLSGAGIVSGASTLGVLSGVSGSSAIGAMSVANGLGGAMSVPTGASLVATPTAAGSVLSSISTAMPYIAAAIAIASLSGLFKNKVAAPEMGLINFMPGQVPRTGNELSPYIQSSPFGDLVVSGQHLTRNGLSLASINAGTADLAKADTVFASSLTEADLAKINRWRENPADPSAVGIWGWTSGEQGGGDFSAAIQRRLDRITDIVGGWADDLFDTFSGSVNDSYAMATAIFGARGNEFAETLATELLALGQGNAFQQSGEQLADTFIRLIGSIGAVNEVMEKLDLTLFDASLAGADAANTLVEAFGSLDTFKAAASDYYSQFYAQQDQLALVTEQLGAEFDKLSLTMPGTHDGFRALVDALDLTTQSGVDTFAALMAIAPAFDLVADATEAAAAAAEQAAAQLAASRQGWQDKLDVLTGATTERQLALQRDLASTTDAATQALIRQVYAQEEMLAAAEAAAQAAAQAAAAEAERASQYTSTARDLQIELANATGNAGLATSIQRAQELQALREIDPTGMLARIKEQIYGALDAEALRQEQQRAAEEQARLAQQAAEASRRAAEEQARAAEQVRQAWQRAADGILDTMRSLREDLMGTGAQGFAAAQANFAIATAAARAGDQDAANKLPELARAVADLSANVAGSRLEQDLITARTLASLSGTLESLKKFGIEVPAFASGGLHHGGLRLVGERGPELEATGPARIYNFDQMRGLLQGGDIAAELRELRRENARLREIVEPLLAAIEANTGNTHGALTGAPILVEVA